MKVPHLAGRAQAFRGRVARLLLLFRRCTLQVFAHLLIIVRFRVKLRFLLFRCRASRHMFLMRVSFISRRDATRPLISTRPVFLPVFRFPRRWRRLLLVRRTPLFLPLRAVLCGALQLGRLRHCRQLRKRTSLLRVLLRNNMKGSRSRPLARKARGHEVPMVLRQMLRSIRSRVHLVPMRQVHWIWWHGNFVIALALLRKIVVLFTSLVVPLLIRFLWTRKKKVWLMIRYRRRYRLLLVVNRKLI